MNLATGPHIKNLKATLNYYNASIHILYLQRPNPKSLTGGKSRLGLRVKVDSGIVLPMVHVLESTLEST